METINVSDVIFRDDLYPRIEADPSTIQRYADDLDVLPPIEINQHNELIDGFHRWTAHKKKEAETIKVQITKTESDSQLLTLAIERNAKHGLQLSQKDKKKMAVKIYVATDMEERSEKKKELVQLLSVSTSALYEWLRDIDEATEKEKREIIFYQWLSCQTQQDIADAVGDGRKTIDDKLKVLADFPDSENSPKVSEIDKKSILSVPTLRQWNFSRYMDFEETENLKPKYNVWTFTKKTNHVGYFGNSEQRILDNLIYLYTKPFDIVVDPFAGGGATIDVCKKRLRRYWVSDRKPVVEREKDIRQLDITESLPGLNKRWSDVSLTYLDPPYWKQAEGKYSEDATDLANMPLEDFTRSLVKTIQSISKKQSRGVIALLIQPTQWNAPDREYTDHVVQVVSGVGNKRVKVINRISCPYNTEQCNPQMVNWAKDNKELLVLSRELIIWRILDGK